MTGALPQRSGAELADRALQLDATGSPDAVAELLALAGGRRAPLEAARSLFIARLHRRSGDFDATKALRSVSVALSQIGWETPVPPSRRRRRSGRPS